MRLIDADALIEKIHIMPDTANKFSFEHLVMTYAPTIDAVPVVRCGECKLHKKSVMDKDGYVICTQQRTHTRKNFFCANGKRMDD